MVLLLLPFPYPLPPPLNTLRTYFQPTYNHEPTVHALIPSPTPPPSSSPSEPNNDALQLPLQLPLASPSSNPHHHPPRSIAAKLPLRILCLGASITYGYASPDGNGYRYALRGRLVAGGNDVNMVGSRSAGNMSDNQVEAYPGLRIAQVAAKAGPGLRDKPNVVLIFLGSEFF